MPIDLPDWQYGFSIIPKTALKPNQSSYFATTLFQLPPKSSVIVKIGLGFTINEEWIPFGKKFSIWYVSFTADENCLIDTGIAVESQENPGQYTFLALKHGYGNAEYLSGVFFDFEQMTRPVYYVYNHSDNTITIFLTIFGVVEVIV